MSFRLKGLEISFQKLLEFKKQKNSPLVVMRDGKIVKIMAEDYYKVEVKKDYNLSISKPKASKKFEAFLLLVNQLYL
jgi:PHD/YefM family antitoxin component YafN of YafNO toxin-antitoxin module